MTSPQAPSPDGMNDVAGVLAEARPYAEYPTTIQLEQIDALRHALTCAKPGCQMAARSVLDGIEYRIAMQVSS